MMNDIALKRRLVLGRPARPGWSLKVVMVKTALPLGVPWNLILASSAKQGTVEEFGNIDLLVIGWG